MWGALLVMFALLASGGGDGVGDGDDMEGRLRKVEHRIDRLDELAKKAARLDRLEERMERLESLAERLSRSAMLDPGLSADEEGAPDGGPPPRRSQEQRDV